MSPKRHVKATVGYFHSVVFVLFFVCLFVCLFWLVLSWLVLSCFCFCFCFVFVFFPTQHFQNQNCQILCPSVSIFKIVMHGKCIKITVHTQVLVWSSGSCNSTCFKHMIQDACYRWNYIEAISAVPDKNAVSAKI